MIADETAGAATERGETKGMVTGTCEMILA